MKEADKVPTPRDLRNMIADLVIYFESKGYNRIETMTGAMCFLPTLWVQMDLDMEDVQEACRVMIRTYSMIKGNIDGTVA